MNNLSFLYHSYTQGVICTKRKTNFQSFSKTNCSIYIENNLVVKLQLSCDQAFNHFLFHLLHLGSYHLYLLNSRESLCYRRNKQVRSNPRPPKNKKKHLSSLSIALSTHSIQLPMFIQKQRTGIYETFQRRQTWPPPAPIHHQGSLKYAWNANLSKSCIQQDVS